MTSFLLGAFVFVVAFLGASIGSFLNVVIWRVPAGESLISPPSHCPKCGAKIRWFDNVPIFAWFWLGGKCRDCKAPIRFRYPLVEFLCCCVAGLFAAAILLGGWTGFESQTLYWNDFSDWTAAWKNATSDGAANPSSFLANSSFATDVFLEHLRSATCLALVWTFAAFAALVLGFVEWDVERSPWSLIATAAAIPCLGFLLIGSFCEDWEIWGVRAAVFGASCALGAAPVFVFWRGVSSQARCERATLGALLGFCVGWRVAFFATIVVAVLAIFIRRSVKREVFGLLVFVAIVLSAISESVWFSTR